MLYNKIETWKFNNQIVINQKYISETLQKLDLYSNIY